MSPFLAVAHLDDGRFAIVPNEEVPTLFNSGEREEGVVVFRARRSDVQPTSGGVHA